MKKIFLIVLGLIVLCLSVYLFLELITEPMGQKSILEESDCKLPCWNQIYIRKTSQSDFVRIISELQFVDKTSISQQKFSKNIDSIVGFVAHIGLKILPKYKIGYRGAAFFADDKLVFFSLSGNLKITLQQIVKQFGNPDLVLTTGRRPEIYVTLVYMDEGIAVGNGVADEDAAITEALELNYLYMFDPAMYEMLSEERLFLSSDYSYPWNGYGVVKDKYWPPIQP
jgi:hypothetical protein